MSNITCIPPDLDISGIGVRVAIYTQNHLSFIPAVWAIWDGEHKSQRGLEHIEPALGPWIKHIRGSLWLQSTFGQPKLLLQRHADIPNPHQSLWKIPV
ncbi:hypothetical protein B0H14DRAFT_3438327 [Mycena olivaceomarginata]|nr:hypothetical protein B0H14DRAFT_3438327 [Mycena olivaceomarginata]